jgi:hypothetical protein
VRRDHHDTVHPLEPQTLDRVRDRLAAQRLQAGDAHGVAGRISRAFDAHQRRGGPEQRGVERHDAERLRTARDERARHRVGPVVELAHRREHPVSRFGPDLLRVVDDA